MTYCTISQSNATTGQQAETTVYRKPSSNIVNFEKHVELQLAIPGVTKDSVNVTTKGNSLRIEAPSAASGPWGNVTYQHEFALHKDLNAQNISAHLSNGILSLRIPKLEQATAQRIEIN